MKRQKGLWKGCLICAGMLLCILDSKSAMFGARDGIDLCIKTVVPSLFPFFLLSALFISAISSQENTVLKPLCRLCRISPNSVPLLVTGFLGGYPVGARCVTQAHLSGQLSSDDAKRILAFCNNCGPAFIFGMIAGLFDQWWVPWALWGIHIVGALAAALLIPGGNQKNGQFTVAEPITFVKAMEQTVRVMASVCGWVLVFRVLIEYLRKWVLGRLPAVVQVTVYGLLELSNGCISLDGIENSGLRFLLCSLFIGFGGACVLMQTFSVTTELDKGLYFPGKVIQCNISLLLSYLLQSVAFPREDQVSLPLCIPACLTGFLMIVVIYIRKRQNNSRILQSVGV